MTNEIPEKISTIEVLEFQKKSIEDIFKIQKSVFEKTVAHLQQEIDKLKAEENNDGK